MNTENESRELTPEEKIANLSDEQKNKIIADIFGSWCYQDTMTHAGKLWATVPDWMQIIFSTINSSK